MKKHLGWMAAAAVLMIGCPWMAVAFAGDAGMAVCFVLFFGINPLFSALCGWAAGRDIKRLWILPVGTAGLFLLGVWIFFELGEPGFLVYAGIYLVIGFAAMLLRAALGKRGWA